MVQKLLVSALLLACSRKLSYKKHFYNLVYTHVQYKLFFYKNLHKR